MSITSDEKQKEFLGFTAKELVSDLLKAGLDFCADSVDKMEHAILKATDFKEDTAEFKQLQTASDNVLKTFIEGYQATLIAFLNHLNEKVFDVPIEINTETQEVFPTDISSEEEELNEKIINAQKELQSLRNKHSKLTIKKQTYEEEKNKIELIYSEVKNQVDQLNPDLAYNKDLDKIVNDIEEVEKNAEILLSLIESQSTTNS